MTSTVQQATTNTTPYDDDFLNASAESALKQIDLALRRGVGDDLNRHSVENARSGIAQFANDVSQRLNFETDEYNGLLDVIERLEASKLEFNARIVNLSVFKDIYDQLMDENFEVVQWGCLENGKYSTLSLFSSWI